MKRIIFLAFMLAVATSSFAQAKTDDAAAFQNEWMEMLENSGTFNTLAVVTKSVVNQVKKQMPDAKPEMIKELTDTLRASFTRLVTEDILPTYQKHFTLEDVRAINVFYRSEVGKKLKAINPIMAEEILPVSQRWASDFSQKVQDIIEKWNLRKQ